MINPTISVLLPCYNAAATVRESIDSVLGQTFSDFELLILDDGSDEPIAELNDARIRYLRSPNNLGLSSQLNIGIDQARGAFIARLDADDIAMPERLAKQIALLEQSPTIGICGSDAQLFDADGDREIWSYPNDPESCLATLFFRSPFVHPSVMMRKSVLDQNGLRYDESFRVAQDYELWHRLLKVTRGTNLSECLTRYRISDSQLTSTQHGTKVDETRQIRAKILEDLGDDKIDLYTQFLADEWDESPELFAETAEWLNAIVRANRRTQTFPQEAFTRQLAEVFFHRCQCATRRGFNGLAAYRRLEFSDQYRVKPVDHLRLRVKSILKTSLSS